MEKLFDDTLYVSKERPVNITNQQRDELYTKLAIEAIDCNYSNNDVETVKEDLSMLEINQDGFEIAKELEDSGDGDYEFRGDFIDWLDGLSFRYLEILKENVKLWVKAHNPQPKFSKGDKLIVTSTISYGIKRDLILYVYEIKMDEGVYIMAENKKQQGGYLLTFERVEECCELQVE